MTRRRVEPEVLPRREELDALAHYYHHLQNEHERSQPEGAVRRELEDRLLRARERFERIVEEWVDDPDLRAAWLEHVKNRAPKPDGPPAIDPLVYQGVSASSGSVLEIHGRVGELEARIDGTLVGRVVAEKDLAKDRPFPFRFEGQEFRETFNVSDEALSALRDFVAENGHPPWEHASELLADGLIDVHFDLTPRGRRALAEPV
jgi:hypothetical protein